MAPHRAYWRRTSGMNTRLPMHTWRRLLACLALNPKTKRHYRAMRYGRKSSAWQTYFGRDAGKNKLLQERQKWESETQLQWSTCGPGGGPHGYLERFKRPCLTLRGYPLSRCLRPRGLACKKKRSWPVYGKMSLSHTCTCWLICSLMPTGLTRLVWRSTGKNEWLYM